jgi:hypothetical protein
VRYLPGTIMLCGHICCHSYRKFTNPLTCGCKPWVAQRRLHGWNRQVLQPRPAASYRLVEQMLTMIRVMPSGLKQAIHRVILGIAQLIAIEGGVPWAAMSLTARGATPCIWQKKAR